MQLINGKQLRNNTVKPEKLNFTGFVPSAAQDPATVAYVDAKIQGLTPKEPVRLATTEPLGALSGTPTIDGLQTTVNDRILVKNQGNAINNGVYNVRAGAWERALDFNDIPVNNVTRGTFCFVQTGTENGGTGWFISNPGQGDLIVGTDPLIFSQTSKVTTYNAGASILITGNTLSVDLSAYVIDKRHQIADQRPVGQRSGFEYLVDHSEDFSDLSLVHKLFVETRIQEELALVSTATVISTVTLESGAAAKVITWATDIDPETGLTYLAKHGPLTKKFQIQGFLDTGELPDYFVNVNNTIFIKKDFTGMLLENQAAGAYFTITSVTEPPITMFSMTLNIAGLPGGVAIVVNGEEWVGGVKAFAEGTVLPELIIFAEGYVVTPDTIAAGLVMDIDRTFDATATVAEP